MPYKDYEKTKAKAREYSRKYPERIREALRKYRETHREDWAENNSRRIYVGRMYLGMCGTTRTERERGDHGKAE